MSLPKFLIADSGDDRTFIIHLESPRLLLEAIEEDPDQAKLEVAEWLESERDFIANELANGREPAQTLARVMREAGDFYVAELEREIE